MRRKKYHPKRRYKIKRCYPREPIQEKKGGYWNKLSNTIRKFFRREPISGITIIGFILWIVSLFLPVISVSFGIVKLDITWINLLEMNLTNFIVTPFIIGVVLIVLGLGLGKNWIISTGSLFCLLPTLLILYILSKGIKILGLSISLIGLGSWGLWINLIGGILMVYGSIERLRPTQILISIGIVVIYWLLIFQSIQNIYNSIDQLFSLQ